MVAYCPKGEQVHVVQTFPRETLHGSTKFTADYIGAVGIWRNPSGEWTTVYHVQQDEISRTQMKWITEEMVCGQALEMLWLKHGRLHLEGGTISLRVHRDVNSWPQSLPQNTIQLTKITDEARFPSLVECQRQFQQPRKWLGHVNEADDWSSFPPSPIFAGPVHRDAVSLDSDKTDLTSHQRTWKRPSCRSGLKASSRRQKFFNRTKTGCFTCRSRRKKCDGTQPICKFLRDPYGGAGLKMC